MNNLPDLIRQRDLLNDQIEQIRQQEKQKAINKIKAIVFEYEICSEDIFVSDNGISRNSRTGSKVAPKYRGPNGLTWTGRGKPPSWIQGKDRAEFLIK